MASSHGINLIKNLTISSASTGLFDANGNSLPTVDILAGTGETSNNYAYSKTIELSPKSIEHILVAICEGCVMEVLLQISPDGKNWVNCTLSDGSVCEANCTAQAGDCTTKIIDTSMLQFARVRVGNAGSSGGTCNVTLNFTLN
tara:strand:+ start:1477 stop:1908 length:432 start_codon:yes stop_codon:yes gene_type:complete